MIQDQDFLLRHTAILCASYARLTGGFLLAPELPPQQRVAVLDAAPFAVVSHDTRPDPIFNYANTSALRLFEMDWEQFTRLPSRFSAEALEQSAREALLARVSRNGYVDDYSGVRISASGRRFMVHNATVWNLFDESGEYYGQAALLKEWDYL